MWKKTASIMLALAMLLALATVLPASADGDNLVTNGSFETLDGGVVAGGNITLNGTAVLKTDGGQDGNNYVSIPDGDGSVGVTVAVQPETNYVFSVWAKTSRALSLYGIKYTYVEDNGWYDWTTYCDNNGIPYISLAEATTDFSGGLTTADGGDWQEYTYEFRTPHHATHVTFYVKAHPAILDDAYRMIDNISVKATEPNLILNGKFDCLSRYDASVTMNNWTFYSSEHYNGTNEYVHEADGNNYFLLKDGGAGDWRGVGIDQNLFLYPGNYELSWRQLQVNAGGRVVQILNTDDEHTNFNDLRHISGDAGSGNGQWSYLKNYFTVYQAGMYTIRFGNCWFPGNFAYDDIKLMRSEPGSIAFAKSASTYTDTSDGDVDFLYTPAENVVAGDTIYPFGILPKAEDASAAMITSVYKVKANGKRKLVSVKTSEVTPGQTIIGAPVSIPAVAEGETLEAQVMVWNSVSGLVPLSEVFPLG